MKFVCAAIASLACLTVSVMATEYGYGGYNEGYYGGGGGYNMYQGYGNYGKGGYDSGYYGGGKGGHYGGGYGGKGGARGGMPYIFYPVAVPPDVGSLGGGYGAGLAGYRAFGGNDNNYLLYLLAAAALLLLFFNNNTTNTG